MGGGRRAFNSKAKIKFSRAREPLSIEQLVDACARIRVHTRGQEFRSAPPPPAPAAQCLHASHHQNHASPALSPTASASAHRLKVLEQPEAVGRIRLGPALDGEEVEPVGGLLALLEELRLELLLRVLYPRQQVPAESKRVAARERMACGWRRWRPSRQGSPGRQGGP